MKPDQETATESEWRIAKQRADALSCLIPRSNPAAVAEVARDLQLSSAMVYRLLALYRNNPSPGALLQSRGGRVPGSSQLSAEVNAVLHTLIESYYLRKERPRVADLHRQVCLACHGKSLPAPSYKAVWLRVQKIDPELLVRGREGSKAARAKFKPVGAGLRPTRALELVQIDHTPADIIVVDELERRPIGRPWLTLLIDVATRVVAGFHLSLDPPSSTSVALALSHAVLRKQSSDGQKDLSESWPVEGLPETIHLDNAKEFHGQALERGCEQHGIALTFRPPQTPHFGGHIERLIGTMMGDVHLLPGTTFSSIKARGEYKSAAHASLTMRELEEWLTLQIVDVYHRRKHRGIGMSPLAAWTQSLVNQQAIRRPVDARKFYIDFLPGESRLIRRDGIQLFGIHYWDSALSPLAGRSTDKYVVRYDPRDLSHVYVKDHKLQQYLKVPYRDIRHPPITLSEHRSITKQLAKNTSLARNEETIFTAILEQRALVDRARANTVKARRARAIAAAVAPSAKAKESLKTSISKPHDLLQTIKPYDVEVWD